MNNKKSIYNNFYYKLSASFMAVFILVSFLFTGISSAFAEENSAKVIELYKGNEQSNINFQCENMLPGDSISRDFSVKVYHEEDITLYFNEKITDETKNLGDVLQFKVIDVDTGEVICDSTFSQADGVDYAKTLAANSQGETVVNYRIEISVDTSVGNEYQAAVLTADFKWYVNENDQGGLTTIPQTGDKPITVIWMILGIACVVLITSLLIKRSKGDRENG